MAMWKVLVGVLCVAVVCHARPDGAPEEACLNDGRPLHNDTVPSIEPSPYWVTWEFTPPDGPEFNYTVTVTGNTTFRGVLIAAVHGNEIVGSFAPLTDPNLKMRPCLDDDDVVTHTNRNEKTSVSAEWIPPVTGTNGIHFRATVVQSFAVYWVGIRSDTLPPE